MSSWYIWVNSDDVLDTCIDNEGYQRIVVEKPFGRDYNSSKVLNQYLQDLFPESSIYVSIESPMTKMLIPRELTIIWERRWFRTC